MKRFPPERIVCLTEETVETLYLLGEEDRIVGVSGYAVRPPRVRKEKPRVSAFISADLPKILALDPDVVLTFSDIQAEIVTALVKAGIAVHAFNQRDIQGILAMIRFVGALVARGEDGNALASKLADNLAVVQRRATALPRRPRVYFEEWDDPMISGIGWVSEIVEAAGGIDVFADRRDGKAARDRFVTAEEVRAAAPDIVIASWCGKKFARERFLSRPGFADLPAARTGHLHDVKSPLILQPGPAALTDGLEAVATIITGWATDN